MRVPILLRLRGLSGLRVAGSRAAGFSLLELLVALVVFAVISAVALPVYTQYADRTFRREAQADLLRCGQALEVQAAERFSYTNAADSNGDGVADADAGPIAQSLCAPSSPDRYQISVDGSATTFALLATPVGPMVGDGAISFDSAGNRGWDKDDDGNFEPGEEDRWGL